MALWDNSFPLNLGRNSRGKKVNPMIKAFLKEFEPVFEEPKKLPLVRGLNHKIPLMSNVKPLNIRPYRSSYIHREEIEKMVKGMFFNRIIQPSSSPFSLQFC